MKSVVAAAILLAPASVFADFTQTFTGDPHAGIHRETWKDDSIPAVVRVMRIDLTSAQIQLVATMPDQRGTTTSAYSTAEGAAVAINGDSFAVGDMQPLGLAMGQAMVWPDTADDGTSAVFDFRSTATPTTGEYTAAEIVPTGLVVTPATLPTGTLGVVSGRPLLVRSGQPTSQFDCNDSITIACERAPRSALALSADGNTLYLAVVDGWQASSAGLTDAELASFLVATYGIDSAIALDSGSSSTLVVDGTLVSSPSDGVERAVANHLAVQFAPTKSGGLIGLVCEGTISPCNNPIDAATVTLDTGATKTTDTSGVYQFPTLTPRYTCATATKANYYPTTRCVVVGPGPNPTYDSIAMQKCPSGGCPPPDAAMPDARIEYPDAPPLAGDAGSRGSGNPATGSGGGCCQTGPDRPPWALALLVVWCLARRRCTTS
ncbi:MAG TPA: phosphodiester glycosidase family protein [Kofleriaceae bacterium]|nr:phosphodiester glycosidase family protein [Kofleriaceae bacterium]